MPVIATHKLHLLDLKWLVLEHRTLPASRQLPAVLLALVLVHASAAQTLPTDSRLPRTRAGPQPTSSQILTEAAASLARHRSVAASMRQRIDLYGRRLVGSGSYRQLQTGTDLLFRLELKVPVGETLASLLQVCDGRYLWTYRVLPDKQVEQGLDASLSAVDLNRVREMSFTPRVGSVNFGLGGLPGLLNQTAHVFDFRRARRSVLHGTPVWILSGEIRQEVWRQLGGAETAGEGGANLEHVPDLVNVAVGTDDLFPYQFEFRKTRPDEPSLGAAMIARSDSWPIMTLELFEVQIDVPVDPEIFSFRPPNFQIDDVTEEFLANERLSDGLDQRQDGLPQRR